MEPVLIGVSIVIVLFFLVSRYLETYQIVSMMYYNGKSFATFIAVAVATLLPNFINILNISNQIKQKEKEL
jgi:hypothetical protein